MGLVSRSPINADLALMGKIALEFLRRRMPVSNLLPPLRAATYQTFIECWLRCLGVPYAAELALKAFSLRTDVLEKRTAFYKWVSTRQVTDL